jgi:hypothetical protein
MQVFHACALDDGEPEAAEITHRGGNGEKASWIWRKWTLEMESEGPECGFS